MPPLDEAGVGNNMRGPIQPYVVFAPGGDIEQQSNVAAAESGTAFKPFSISTHDLAKLSEDGHETVLQVLGGPPALERLLETSLKGGVEGSPADLARRRAAFGANVHPQKAPHTLAHFVWEAMQDSLVQVLFICAIVSIAVSIPANGDSEGWYDGAGIFLALFIIITVSAISNYRQSLQFFRLNQEKARIMVQVTRGGRRQTLVIHDIVVGDLVHLSVGDHVPADGLVVEAHSLAIDESSMTGESDLVHKDPTKRPFVLAGCTVVEGFGDMLIRLTKVATLMGQMGLAVGIALFFILVLRYSLSDMNFQKVKAADISNILTFFMVSVTVLVIAIPEGLPLAVTLTLAFSVHRMMEDKSLVRHLEACETMGSATTICSDKTGTLTLNQMTVTKAWMGGALRPSFLTGAVDASNLKILHEAVAQNSSGSVYQPKGGRHEVSGSPTERAILDWGVKTGMMFEEVRALSSIVEVAPFSSEKKVMGVLLRGENGVHRCHWKGAAEVVLENCQYWLDAEGNSVPIAHKKAELLGVITNMAHQALRTICLAYWEQPPGVELTQQNDQFVLPETGLTLLAIVGIKDPCRPEVPESVRICQNAGIFVRMVTGDSLETAKAIARECGILTAEGTALEGAALRGLSAEALRALLPRLQVVARAAPGDKLRLVQALKEEGEVVAVTGDGSNDGPALREADIGLAMGICGTEVAKESADIVILDDNFASIVKTVSWGRSVYKNIQRFLQFQITTTVVAIGLNFVAALITGDAPLRAVQMLWVDLIQDTFGALALASEPPSKNLIKQAPVDRKESLVTLVMWRNILSQSLYQLVIMLCLWFKGKEWLGLPGAPGVPEVSTLSGAELNPGDGELVTIIFSIFVFCQVFNEINSRKLEEWNVFEGISKNPIFLLILFIEVVCQLIIVEFLGDFFGTVHISPGYWLFCILIGAGGIPFGFLMKLIPLPPWGTKALPSRMKKGILELQGKFQRIEL